MLKLIIVIFYYGIARWLPASTTFVVGTFCKKVRGFCGFVLFKKCGNNINIERGAHFGKGSNLEIGDNSGIGKNCTVPSNIIIGNNVMMGPNCFFLHANHNISEVNIPMIQQGFDAPLQIVIEDDVWIGRQVLVMAGKKIAMGSVVAAGCVLTKDFSEYSIVGGNPSRVLKQRK